MTQPQDNEGGRQPGGDSGEGDETGTETGRTTGTYSDAGDESDPPGQGDGEAG